MDYPSLFLSSNGLSVYIAWIVLKVEFLFELSQQP